MEEEWGGGRTAALPTWGLHSVLNPRPSNGTRGAAIIGARSGGQCDAEARCCHLSRMPSYEKQRWITTLLCNSRVRMLLSHSNACKRLPAFDRLTWWTQKRNKSLKKKKKFESNLRPSGDPDSVKSRITSTNQLAWYCKSNVAPCGRAITAAWDSSRLSWGEVGGSAAEKGSFNTRQ